VPLPARFISEFQYSKEMVCQDVQNYLPDQCGKPWHKSPSLSSATTDEDFSTTMGSPKTRWADLSEEDDEMDTMELYRFADSFSQQETEETGSTAQNITEGCRNNMAPAHDDTAHGKKGENARGTSDKIFNAEQRVCVNKDVDNLDHVHERRQARVSSDVGGVHFSAQLQRKFDHATATGQGSAVMPAMKASAVIPAMQKEVPQRAVVPAVYTVMLSGIPPKLCNDVCLDAILWASGVQRSTLGYQSKKSGHVVIDFQSLDSATHCVNHFKACSWSTGKLQVEVMHPNGSLTSDGQWRPKQDHKAFAHNKHSDYAKPFGRRFSGYY